MSTNMYFSGGCDGGDGTLTVPFISCQQDEATSPKSPNPATHPIEWWNRHLKWKSMSEEYEQRQICSQNKSPSSNLRSKVHVHPHLTYTRRTSRWSTCTKDKNTLTNQLGGCAVSSDNCGLSGSNPETRLPNTEKTENDIQTSSAQHVPQDFRYLPPRHCQFPDLYGAKDVRRFKGPRQDYFNLGITLERARITAHLTQLELARAVGATVSMISDAEKNIRVPEPRIRDAISRLLKTKLYPESLR
jgi:DNA-binding XRE family transcriptional regulator